MFKGCLTDAIELTEFKRAYVSDPKAAQQLVGILTHMAAGGLTQEDFRPGSDHLFRQAHATTGMESQVRNMTRFEMSPFQEQSCSGSQPQAAIGDKSLHRSH